MKRSPNLPRLSKEKVLKAADLNEAAARFLVSDYYRAQELRKRADMQLRHLGDNAAGSLVTHLEYVGGIHAQLEQDILRELKAYAEQKAVGRWMLAHVGVGPVIAAGMLAHLDINRAPTAGHFKSFAGLNPETRSFKKGEKRRWCHDMHQLCYHFGECVKRQSNHPDCYYGIVYRERKAELIAENEAGEHADRARNRYTTNSAEVRATLAQGKLPAWNLDRQACNYAAWIFLSHLHGVMYWDHYGVPPPKPFAEQHLGHTHILRIQRMDLFPGLEEAYYYGNGKKPDAPVAKVVKTKVVAKKANGKSESRTPKVLRNRSEPKASRVSKGKSESKVPRVSRNRSEPLVKRVSKRKSEPNGRRVSVDPSEPKSESV